jgi:tetratricopeptide (TPR) repeat protein
MLPRAKDLRKLWFEWPESRFGRFNFQRDEQIDALRDLLVDDGLPAVVVLGGEPGIGRGFLCEAAAQRTREQGREVAVWHLDLDGFEPDAQNPLTLYLRHLIEDEERRIEASRDKAKGAARSAAKTLSKLDLIGEASEVAASLLSLLWQFEDPLQRFADLLSRPRGQDQAARRDDPETLHRFLAELTRDRKLLVYVSDPSQLTSPLRRWLIREAERAPEPLLLVIPCSLEQETERAAPEARHQPARFDVHPLEPAELRDLLDRRFEPNAFPADLVTALMRRCHGRPAAVANQVADLMEAEILSDEDGTWRLPPEGLEDERLVEAFSRGLFEEVDKRLADLAEEELDLARAIRDLLSLAALCGRYVPMAALLEHLRLDEEAVDVAVDWVDDVLVGELGWMEDLGFKLPGFPGHGVYAFTHPLLPRVVLDQDSQVAREVRAVSLLRFLEQRVQVSRRGWARCFLAIAEYLGERERAPYERSLGWWIGLEAAEALQEEVQTAIEREEVDPELVWRVALDSDTWPAYRRLAVLNAYALATVGRGADAISVLPFARLVDFHLLHASLLIDVGRYSDALVNAQSALKLISREPLKRARALNLSGLAQLHSGDASAARCSLEDALATYRGILGEEHPATLMSINNLAISLEALGDLTGARQLSEQVLEARRRVLGEEHPDTVMSMNNLASTLKALGDFRGARQLNQEALEVSRQVLGEEHPHTIKSLGNLAGIESALGDLRSARQLDEQALEVCRRILGEEHPDTLTTMCNLASTLKALGDLAAARRFDERALEVSRRILGKEHPHTLTIMTNLALVLEAQGDLAGAKLLEENVLAASQRVFGEEHLNTLTVMNNLAATQEALGDLEGAHRLQEKVLDVIRRELGEEHPHTLTSLSNLAATRKGLGDLAGARTLYEQVLQIRRRVLGEEHLDTLTSMNNLASLLEPASAIDILGNIVNVRRRVLGEEHPGTMTAMSNLAVAQAASGDGTGARRLNELTLEVRRRVLGEEHPDTIASMNNLAWTLYSQGEKRTACELMVHVITVCRRTLGEEHPWTETSRESLQHFEAEAAT